MKKIIAISLALTSLSIFADTNFETLRKSFEEAKTPKNVSKEISEGIYDCVTFSYGHSSAIASKTTLHPESKKSLLAKVVNNPGDAEENFLLETSEKSLLWQDGKGMVVSSRISNDEVVFLETSISQTYAQVNAATDLYKNAPQSFSKAGNKAVRYAACFIP